MKSYICVILSALTLAGGMNAHAAQQEQYPTRPIRMIVPYPPGSSSNAIRGRALSQRRAEARGQQVVVDNRSGASGTMGSEIAAKSPPDGYTLLIAVAGPLAVGPSVYKKLGYDSMKDFAPVAMFASVPYLMVVNNSVPATNVKELIALAKSKPGGLNFASSGTGGSPHLCGELFKTMAGVDMVHIPYKGGALAVVDVLGGQVQMLCTGVTALNQHVRAGKMRAIGMATMERSSLMPEIPTLAEQGLKGFEVVSWTGVVAPAKTPASIVNRLYQEIEKITRTDDMKKFVAQQGAEIALKNPQQFAAYLKEDIERWAKVVTAAKIPKE